MTYSIMGIEEEIRSAGIDIRHYPQDMSVVLSKGGLHRQIPRHDWDEMKCDRKRLHYIIHSFLKEVHDYEERNRLKMIPPVGYDSSPFTPSIQSKAAAEVLKPKEPKAAPPTINKKLLLLEAV